MPANQDEHGEDFFADSELSRHEDAPQVDLPPEKSRTGSFYDGSRGDWWWDGKFDPCPVRPKGNNNGLFFFLTPQGELRSFTSRALASDNGLSELFCADLWWLIRHFPSRDREGNLTKRPHVKLAADAMMRACFDKGIFSDSVELRLAGTWRGPDGRPVVHAGDVLVHDGQLLPISADLGSPLYCIAQMRATSS